MKIVVCIKQVPDTQKVQVDPVTGVLIREGIETKMNPFDLFAIETALQIKSKVKDCSILVITMGPPAAKEILLEAFSLGVDEAYLLTDRRFAGADVLATSFTLSQGIKALHIDYDLILCGKQTTDGDTAQVGPAIGEYLDIPHVSWVKEFISADDSKISVKQEMMDSVATISMTYPCLLTVEKGIFQPGLPSYIKKKASADKEIHVITLDECEVNDPKRYGLSGSPTQVERIFTPTANDSTERFEADGPTNAQSIYEKLVELKVVEG